MVLVPRAGGLTSKADCLNRDSVAAIFLLEAEGRLQFGGIT